MAGMVNCRVDIPAELVTLYCLAFSPASPFPLNPKLSRVLLLLPPGAWLLRRWQSLDWLLDWGEYRLFGVWAGAGVAVLAPLKGKTFHLWDLPGKGRSFNSQQNQESPLRRESKAHTAGVYLLWALWSPWKSHGGEAHLWSAQCHRSPWRHLVAAGLQGGFLYPDLPGSHHLWILKMEDSEFKEHLLQCNWSRFIWMTGKPC